MSLIHVAVGVLFNTDNKILIAERPTHVFQGGFWEFPGGKIEMGETPFDALVREFKEEIGITITQAKPLTKIEHDYSEQQVLLDVWKITAYQGDPHGREGQPIQWVTVADLKKVSFPAANQGIVIAIERLFNVSGVVDE